LVNILFLFFFLKEKEPKRTLEVRASAAGGLKSACHAPLKFFFLILFLCTQRKSMITKYAPAAGQ
jgi:hypothetical protein